MTLAHAGVEVVALVTDQPRPQTYRGFRAGRPAALADAGRHRRDRDRARRAWPADGGRAASRDGATRCAGCDTVVFTGDWVPDHELARPGGLASTRARAAPQSTACCAPRRPACSRSATSCTPSRRRTSPRCAPPYGRRGDQSPAARDDEVAVPQSSLVAARLLWPGSGRTSGVPTWAARRWGRCTIWCKQFVERPTFRVRQDDRVLLERGWRRTLVPNRPYAVAVGWATDVDPDGGDVLVPSIVPPLPCPGALPAMTGTAEPGHVRQMLQP